MSNDAVLIADCVENLAYMDHVELSVRTVVVELAYKTM